MRQQIDLMDTAGLLVKGVTSSYDAVLIAFADGSFSCIEAEGDEASFSTFKTFRRSDWSEEALVGLGIMTREEIAADKAEMHRRSIEARTMSERAEYERLKAKFEPKEPGQ
jgi:hypothetical protein